MRLAGHEAPPDKTETLEGPEQADRKDDQGQHKPHQSHQWNSLPKSIVNSVTAAMKEQKDAIQSHPSVLAY
jgi:hypothetical protein